MLKGEWNNCGASRGYGLPQWCWQMLSHNLLALDIDNAKRRIQELCRNVRRAQEECWQILHGMGIWLPAVEGVRPTRRSQDPESLGRWFPRVSDPFTPTSTLVEALWLMITLFRLKTQVPSYAYCLPMPRFIYFPCTVESAPVANCRRIKLCYRRGVRNQPSTFSVFYCGIYCGSLFLLRTWDGNW